MSAIYIYGRQFSAGTSKNDFQACRRQRKKWTFALIFRDGRTNEIQKRHVRRIRWVLQCFPLEALRFCRVCFPTGCFAICSFAFMCWNMTPEAWLIVCFKFTLIKSYYHFLSIQRHRGQHKHSGCICCSSDAYFFPFMDRGIFLSSIL